MSYHTLTHAQLKNIIHHKYVVNKLSLLEPYGLKLINFFIRFVPTWIAPNVITASSVIFSVFVAVLFLWCCPTATEEVPSWLQVLNIIYTIIWYLFDNFDGLQARRLTQTSTLGEFLDHSADALSVFNMAVAVACVVKLGSSPIFVFWIPFGSSCVMYFVFITVYAEKGYTSAWFDQTELALTLTSTFSLVYFYGDSLLQYKLPDFVYIPNVQVLIGFLYMMLIFQSAGESLIKALYNGDQNGNVIFEGKRPWSALVPWGIMTSCAFYCYAFSGYRTDSKNLLLVSCALSAFMIYSALKIKIAGITLTPIPSFHQCLIAPLLLVAVDIINLPISKSYAWMACGIYGWLTNIIFLTEVVLDLRRYLDINVFTITPRKSSIVN